MAAGVGLGLVGRFLGNAVSESFAFAAGVAIGPVLGPPTQALRNTVNAAYPFVPLSAEVAAAVAAERVDDLDRMRTEASYRGLDGARFTDLYREALNAPQVGELLTLLRRGDVDPETFRHGLDKAKLEDLWKGPLAGLRVGRLSPQEVAVMVQRGILPNDGILPVGPPTAAGRVPPMPMVDLNPFAEALAGGYDTPRLEAITRIVGLPPAPGELLQLLNRGVIELADFYRGVAEGNTRNEWGPFLLELRRRLLTPHDYAELNLRGWITPAEMHAGAALSGMEQADVDLLHNMIGRPVNVHQVVTGIARGGTFGGVYEGVPEPYLSAIRQSNVRPEWGNLAYANRYSYPSAFFFRLLLSAGSITAAEGEQAFLELGWAPRWAKLIAEALAPAGGPVADPHVAKAQTQLWSAVHRSYLTHHTSDAQATTALERAGVAAAAVPTVLELWQLERELVRRELTVKQLTKALAGGVKNDATGAPWTAAEVLEALLELGYDQADADVLLAEG